MKGYLVIAACIAVSICVFYLINRISEDGRSLNGSCRKPRTKEDGRKNVDMIDEGLQTALCRGMSENLQGQATSADHAVMPEDAHGAEGLYNVRHMIYAGGNAGGLTITLSVFASWTWTTSIIGSTETYALYGVWGPFIYVGSAVIAFSIFIAFIAFLRKKLPRYTTYLDFVRRRFGRRTKCIYYLFSFAVAAYVLIEQAVGIAFVAGTMYGSSFKIIAFLCVVLSMFFICGKGMNGLLTMEKLTAFVIAAAFVSGVILISINGGLQDFARNLTGDFYKGSGQSVISPALRYFFKAIVIAFSQLVIDPAYYIKASLVEDTTEFKKSFITGGIILWGTLTFLTTMYLGCENSDGSIVMLSGGIAGTIYMAVIFFIGMSTICHYLMGLYGVFTVDMYSDFIREDADDRQKLKFGRIMTIASGMVCAFIAIALEDISLLTIDVFCTIFFAAPLVPLIIGSFSKRNFSILPGIASLAGIITGLVVWVTAPWNTELSQFAGMCVALAVPAVIMLGAGYGLRLGYDG